jgi:hypothetical protein
MRTPLAGARDGARHGPAIRAIFHTPGQPACSVSPHPPRPDAGDVASNENCRFGCESSNSAVSLKLAPRTGSDWSAFCSAYAQPRWHWPELPASVGVDARRSAAPRTTAARWPRINSSASHLRIEPFLRDTTCPPCSGHSDAVALWS